MTKKILVIDDDHDLSREMADILKDEGYAVDVHLYDPENLGSFAPQNYDIIILDFKMPGLSGADILRAIPETAQKVKVLLISGRPFVEKHLREENLLGKVAEVIQKPFSIQALLDKIKAL